jgi:hypothetical protein
VPESGPTIRTPTLDDEQAGLVQYHRDFHLAWPLLLGETDANNVNYGEMGVPMTVIIDTQGVIRQIDQGYRPEKDVAFIESLLKAREPVLEPLAARVTDATGSGSAWGMK